MDIAKPLIFNVAQAQPRYFRAGAQPRPVAKPLIFNVAQAQLRDFRAGAQPRPVIV